MIGGAELLPVRTIKIPAIACGIGPRSEDQNEKNRP
jgi:hypothetical protein